ncbi:MAG: hypothetical protein ACJA09_002211 [Alcanivorax sp.]|jgi:hypothetical protein
MSANICDDVSVPNFRLCVSLMNAAKAATYIQDRL